MEIELRSIADVKPYEKNPRQNEKAVDAVATSLREFGFRQPIVVDAEGVIICGHTRWKAAQKLGLAQVPVHVARDLTPEQVKAYRLADNATGELATWDYELLPLELADLKASSFNLGLLGFSEDGLAKALDAGGPKPGLTDPDHVPDPPDAAVTQPGDLWVLGEHRLLCGDAAKAKDVDRLLEGAPIHLVNSDPPYNVHVEPRSNTAIAARLSNWVDPRRPMHSQAADIARGVADPRKAKSKQRPKDRLLAGDFQTDEDFARMLRAWFGQMARVLEAGRTFYVWGGYANIGAYPPALKEAGLYFSQAIVWVKEHPVLSYKDFLGNHEWCFYGWREGAGHQFFGPNNVPDVWSVKKVAPQKMVHLTEKPVELAMRAALYSSRPGENVLDLFGGSGSTLIACEQIGRRAFLMEIDALYCDVIVQRWEQFTGLKAKREEGR
jgi:DNA modification methylase